MPTKEIGGYFELELPRKQEYHIGALRLNSGRNCFKYILKAKKPSKVYMPFYMDKSMIEPLEALNINFEFYNINKSFEISSNICLKKEEKILYNDYFSLKKDYVTILVKKYGKDIIIDNTQAFFSKPIEEIDTLYSMGGKFFGISDGGYLYTETLLNENFPQDLSYSRTTHLTGRIDKTAQDFFNTAYQESKKERCNKDIMIMSNLTRRILSSIDYENARMLRQRNFYYMHSFLKDFNELEIDFSLIDGPHVYPFLIKNSDLKRRLIENKIYVATYWKEVLYLKGVSDDEKYFVNYLVPLPIDQRYDLADMKRVVDIIKREI